MQIESIKISNFRQFFHETQIKFSVNSLKNVTVIHGANGSGKTSLLNAFKWCFYGYTDFETGNDNILNEAAIQQRNGHGALEVRIGVKFKHEGKTYIAERYQTYKCVDAVQAEPIEKSVFSLDVTGEDGQTKRSKTPFVELKAILPEDLQPYFFFNGERIDTIARASHGGQVRDAIRKLMGLELVDRAIAHLNKAKRHYRGIVREEVSQDQKDLHDLIQAIEENTERFKLAKDSARTAEDEAKSEIKRVNQELRKFEKSRDLQETRDKLETQLVEINLDIARIKAKQKKLIEENGFLALSKEMFSHCEALVERNRKKGVLPFGIKEQFIDDRIEMGVCICGTKISKGSEQHQCLLDVRLKAGTNDVESKYTGVSALLRVHDDIANSFSEDYKEESIELRSCLIRADGIRTEINEISAQLTDIDNKLVANLETRRQEQEAKRDQAIGDKFTATANFDAAVSDLEEKRALLKRLDVQKSEQNIAQNRLDKAEEIAGVLELLQESLANQVRLDLSEKVDETFQAIIRKPRRAIIDEDYSLQVLKTSNDGEEYISPEQSTGESQVASLSFISSIIALAKERRSKDGMFFQGGLYPLVMDSPFGTLDDDYREKIASKVSQLAEQVIIFVSNSQWKGKVAEACQSKLGVSYKLIYHKPYLPKAKENEYETRSETEFEYCTVEEVPV